MVGHVRRFQLLTNQFLKLPSPRSGWQSRSFSSQIGKPPVFSNSFFQPPLSTPLPGLPKAVYANSIGAEKPTQISTLPNGLRVASEDKFGPFCTVGVIIDSGCRYEIGYPSGISHFLEKLAYSSTEEFADKDKILLALEKHGGICDCLSSRDTFIYATSADRRGLDVIVKILGETILRPKITNDEVELTRQLIRFELESLLTRPEQEPLLTDMIHAAAYRDNTLGLPKICPAENVDKIDRSVITNYLQNHFTPDRMVVAGVGVEHEEFVKMVEKHFIDGGSAWQKAPGNVDRSMAQYTGGLLKEECQIPQHVGPSGLPELAHVVIGLEGCSYNDKDFIPMCVLSSMMGGGGSFSAGGPGKGMYTRLYTNVLNRYHWMFNATAYNQTYADTGLFYIHASAPPKHVRSIIDVITKEMSGMLGECSQGELRRAKTQLQSIILMNLEARPVMFEDIARQVLATGARKLPSAFIREIEAVTMEDIERIAGRLLKSQPCVAARGEVSKLPTLSHIQSILLDKDGSHSPGRLSLFT